MGAKRIIILVLAILVIAVGVGSFFAARALIPGGEEAKAQQGGPFTREQIERGTQLREEEFAKPKFRGVVNGIRLSHPDDLPAAQRELECVGDPRYLPIDAASGSPLDIIPTYLPEGAYAHPEGSSASAVVCDNGVISVTRTYIWPPVADFQVGRVQGEHAFTIDASAERVEAGTISGKKAVFVKPVTPEGIGESMVIVAEDFGLTVIYGYMAPMQELIKIAEGLK